MLPEHPSDPLARRIELADGPVSYTDVGDGPVVLAIHGLPGSSHDFRYLGASLESHLRVVRLDLPGFGDTPLATMANPSFAARADFVRQFWDALGIQRPILLAHSVGGPLAIEIAAHHGEAIRGLALLASVGMRPHVLLRKMRVSPRWLSGGLRVPLVGGALLRSARKAFVRAGFSRSTPDVAIRQTIHCAAAIDFDRFAQSVRALAVPTFLSWAADDRLVEDAIGKEMAEACPAGPRLRFNEGGHNIQKTQAVELGAALREWIDGLG